MLTKNSNNIYIKEIWIIDKIKVKFTKKSSFYLCYLMITLLNILNNAHSKFSLKDIKVNML